MLRGVVLAGSVIVIHGASTQGTHGEWSVTAKSFVSQWDVVYGASANSACGVPFIA